MIVPAASPSETPFRLPRFYPILDTAVLAQAGLHPVLLAEALLEAGVRILQYRHKNAWHQSHYDEATAISTLCQRSGVLFVMNDRADFASLLKSALHIGQDDLPPVAARKLISDEVLGLSTHNRPQLQAADKQPVEYISVGPIFATASKLRPDPVVGLAGLQLLRPLTAKPLCAIGGVTLDNAAAVIKAGADAVAVISGLLPEGPAAHHKNGLRLHAETWLQTVA